MRKVGIVQTLCRCLERNDFHLLIVTLVFLRKLSIVNEYKDQIVKCMIYRLLWGLLKNCKGFLLVKTIYFLILPY